MLSTVTSMRSLAWLPMVVQNLVPWPWHFDIELGRLKCCLTQAKGRSLWNNIDYVQIEDCKAGHDQKKREPCASKLEEP